MRREDLNSKLLLLTGRRAFGPGAVGITIGVIMLTLLIGAGFFAPLPHDPLQPAPDQTFQGPSSEFWFGSDNIGRDVFSRVIWGARFDVPLALVATLFSLLIGVPGGLLASTKSKWSERFMRGLDMFQAFPPLVLALVIVALTGNSPRNVVFAIAFVNVPRFVRLVRSEALSLRESRFIEAAIAIGASRTRLLTRHLLPNMTGTILVQASLTAAQSIIVIAAMSFLGIGITPPTASWGAMIQSGSQAIATGQWWVSVFPGLAIFVAVFCFNLIAEGLEVVLGRGHVG